MQPERSQVAASHIAASPAGIPMRATQGLPGDGEKEEDEEDHSGSLCIAQNDMPLRGVARTLSYGR